jgi:hypothetical protein
VIDLANAGEGIRVINPIHPTIAILVIFKFNPCFFVQFRYRHKKTRKEAVLSSPRVSLASKKDS